MVCRALRWEESSELKCGQLGADLIVGADLVYDPRTIPSLVTLLACLLMARAPNASRLQGSEHSHSDCYEEGRSCSSDKDCRCQGQDRIRVDTTGLRWSRPVALLATVVRNAATLAYFETTAAEAGLEIEDGAKFIPVERWFHLLGDGVQEDIRVHILRAAWWNDNKSG